MHYTSIESKTRILVESKNWDIPRAIRDGEGTAGRGEVGWGRAGRGGAGRWRAFSPRRQPSHLPSGESKTTVLDDLSEARTRKSYVNRWRTTPAVDNRFIRGLSAVCSAGRQPLFVPGCWPVDRCYLHPSHARHVREYHGRVRDAQCTAGQWGELGRGRSERRRDGSPRRHPFQTIENRGCPRRFSEGGFKPNPKSFQGWGGVKLETRKNFR